MIKKTVFLSLFSLASMIITIHNNAYGLQLLKTKLQITVLNDLGNVEKGVTIQLFKTEEDYQQSINPIQTKTTDAKGKITFENLDEASYYILAEKGDMNNNDGGSKTEKLTPHRINKITIIISE